MSVTPVTAENYQSFVLEAEQPVLLDFWATWCGPCRMIAPVVEQLAEENPHICFGKVNVDEQSALAAKFGITSIPTLVLLNKGKVVTTSLGYRPKADLEKLLELV